MTFLLFQAFLLMAAAYFLGAFLGCWWRRTFFAPTQTRSIRPTGEAVAGAAATGSALNVPRSEPIPVQPRIEYVEAPETIASRNRFERALRGVGSLDHHGLAEAGPAQAMPVGQNQQPQPVEDTVARFTVAPRSASNDVSLKPATSAPSDPGTPAAFQPASVSRLPLPAQAKSPPAAASAPATEPPAPAAVRVTDTAVAAAAAAAAAVAAAARRRAGDEGAAPPVEAVRAQSPAVPVAAAGGMAGVPAAVRVPPLMPADRQDLKLIRDVDADAERMLNSLGVWRYGDIARWTHGDVAAVNKQLASQSRVQRENWIEQATVLAKGEFTAYARRRLRGEAANAQPTDTARPPRGPMSVAQPGQAPQSASATEKEPRGPAAMASAAAAAVAAAAASASRGRAAVATTAGSRQLAPPVRAPRPVITEIGEPPAPAPQPVATPPAAVSQATSVAQSAPPRTPVPVAPPALAGNASRPLPDSLQRIRGVDAAAEQLMRENGFTRFSEIAAWTATEVEYFDELMEQPGRVNRENWIEQAQILARGGTTLFSRQRDLGSVRAIGAAAAMASAAAASAAAPSSSEPRLHRPSRLADAMRLKQDRTPAAPASTTPSRSNQPDASSRSVSQLQPPAQSPSQPERNDVAGLRSVRSEALRGDRFGGPAPAVEDLKRIRGIGVLIEKKLNSLGISSYDQIANWTADDIAHISEVLDFRGRIERENWIEQARILCAGGHTEFSRRVDRGDIS